MTHWLSVHQPRRLLQNKDKYHVRLTFGFPVAVYWPWATLQEFVSLHTGRISMHIGSEFLFCACYVQRSVGAPPLSTEVLWYCSAPLGDCWESSSNWAIHLRGLLEKYTTFFLCEHLMDYNLARLHEPTLNLSAHVWIFSRLSIASVAGKQHLSEVVCSARVDFSLQGKWRNDWSSATATNFAWN